MKLNRSVLLRKLTELEEMIHHETQPHIRLALLKTRAKVLHKLNAGDVVCLAA